MKRRVLATAGVLLAGTILFATNATASAAPETVERQATTVAVWADVDAGSLLVVERTPRSGAVNDCVNTRLNDPLWLGGWMQQTEQPQAPTIQQSAFAECFAAIHGLSGG